MSYATYPEGLAELAYITETKRLLWLPPSEMTISEWAEANRRLPSSSGRPGAWRADPIQREIQDAACDPSVSEVVFMKATRLGWSEICNNAIGWGLDIHGMSMLMTQPSRDTAEDYCKERLDDMIESTQALREKLRVSTSKGSGSTTRNKRLTNGASIFVASAGNPREMRSKRAQYVIEDEIDGYKNDVSDEGDPDKIIRRRGDEFFDFKLLVGSTPALPRGISRVDRAYGRSSQGIYLCPCPHCNAMEPFLWRHPDNPETYLLRFEKTADRQVIPESIHFTCIRCGAAIEERWKIPMMEAGHWLHRRPNITRVRGFWANGLYAMFPGHWAKMAQEWADAQGDQLELKAFINLHLAETFEAPGESIEPSFLRKRAAAEDRPKGVVPNGVALLIVLVDVQGNRLEAQVVGFDADERASLVDFQVFPGDPTQDEAWTDLDEWLLQGWKHERGATMHPHLVLIDARDGTRTDNIYRFCAPRASRWIFPQMGVNSLASKGWAEESSSKKNGTIRMFLSSTDELKRNFFSRVSQDPNAPRSIHLPSWVSDEYLEQLGSEKRVPVTNVKTRKTTWQWVKTRSRNEALDLWVYSLAAWWVITRILAPHLSGPEARGQLLALATAASTTPEGTVQYAQGPGRRIRSRGFGG